MNTENIINIEKVIKNIPVFDTFCSVDKLYSLVEELESDERFEIDKAGVSELGSPIYHIKFGTGCVKILVVGGPHADEPISGMTVFSLLALLKNSNDELIRQNIQWHIVPFIDPDGAKLNEGWTQKTYNHERFMKNAHKQNVKDQVDGSFPLRYKKLVFDKPTIEASVLMKIIDDVKPEVYYSLHNAHSAGVHFITTHDMGEEYNGQLYAISDEYGIQLKTDLGHDLWTSSADAIFDQPYIPDLYDKLVSTGMDDPTSVLPGGDSSFGYCAKVNPDVFMFTSELGYINHPLVSCNEKRNVNLRQLMLRVDAEKKFLKSVIISQWAKVESALNKNSPFYKKTYPQILTAQKKLQEYIPETPWETVNELLFEQKHDRYALGKDFFNVYMAKYHFLFHNYEVVRLLKDSEQTPEIKAAINYLEPLFDEALADIDSNIDFSAAEVIDCNILAKVQLGASLVALNFFLSRRSATD